MEVKAIGNNSEFNYGTCPLCGDILIDYTDFDSDNYGSTLIYECVNTECQLYYGTDTNGLCQMYEEIKIAIPDWMK
jgi:hypothetical protein